MKHTDGTTTAAGTASSIWTRCRRFVNLEYQWAKLVVSAAKIRLGLSAIIEQANPKKTTGTIKVARFAGKKIKVDRMAWII
jgi:hypothetical protein